MCIANTYYLFNKYLTISFSEFFLTPHTALEVTLQYRSAGGDAFVSDRQNILGVNVGFQVHLGAAASK